MVMSAMLAGSPGQGLLAAAFLVTALAGLAVALVRLELSPAARRRRHLHRALAQAARARAAHTATTAESERRGGLTPLDLARLARFRPRARLMAGEPLRQPLWPARLRLLWREGYAGWIIAVLGGAFSMATHFGMLWLVTGGGWAGAVVITLASTVAMVAVCLWLLLGLVPTR